MDRQLTIADVFNPLDAAVKVQQLDELRMRSRLQAMQMEETQKTQAAKNELMSMWSSLNPQQGQAPQTNFPQPQMQKMGMPQQAAQPQQPNPEQIQQQQMQREAQWIYKNAQFSYMKGDNTAFQGWWQKGQSNPILKQELDKAGIVAMSVTDKGLEQRVNMTPEKFSELKKKNSALEWNPKYTEMNVTTDKTGYITKFDPVKESDKLTDEQIVYGALKENLKREPTKQELLKAIEEHKKQGVTMEKMEDAKRQARELAKQLVAGDTAPSQVTNTFGINVRNEALIEAKKLDPNFKPENAEANFKFKTATPNLMSIVNTQAVIPLLGAFKDRFEAMNNQKLPSYNAAKNWISRNLGEPEVVAYENMRRDLVFEITRALTQSGQMSDARVKLELDNLKNSFSPAQFDGAMKSLDMVLKTRMKALTNVPYDIGTKKEHQKTTKASQKVGRFMVEEE